MADTDQVQTDPQPTPAPEPTPTPAPAQGDDPSTTTTTTPETAEVDLAAVDADAYRRLKDEYFAQPEPQGKPAETEKPSTEPETVTTESTTEDPPVPEPEPEPETRGSKYRPQLGRLPELQKEAIHLAKKLADEGKPIDLAEAERRVKIMYGVEDGQTAPTPPSPKASVSDTKAKIADLRAQKREAARMADVEKVEELNDAIADAQEEMTQAQADEQRAEQQRAQAREQAIEASAQQARKFYPGIRTKGTPLANKFDEIVDRINANGDPVLQEMLSAEDAAWRITVMAANELGVAPVDPSKTPTTASPSPASNQPQPRTGIQPASGAARSTQPTVPIGQLEAKVDAAKTLDDYEKLKEQYMANA